MAANDDDGPEGGSDPVTARGAKVQDRFGLLLILLLGSFVAAGFAESKWAEVVAGALQLGALVVASLATRIWRDHRILGVLLLTGIVALGFSTTSNSGARAVGAAASTIVLIAILGAVLDRVLRHRRVTVQTLYGAACAYFLLGLIFAAVYAFLDSVSSAPLFGESVARSVYSYFSFTTLTTLGFGDYTVKSNLGRRIVAVEAIVGQLFLATTVARLVSLYTRRAQGTSPPDDA
jgi:hypothetical protein